MQLVIRHVRGQMRCLYTEAIPLDVLGLISIRRASHVEPEGNAWFADLAIGGGPKLGPFALRSEALQAEQAWVAEARPSDAKVTLLPGVLACPARRRAFSFQESRDANRNGAEYTRSCPQSHFLTQPKLWTEWPFLPLMRCLPGQQEEYGVLMDAWGAYELMGHSATVFFGNLFLLPRTLDQFLALPHETYDTPEEIIDAGWSVD